MPSAGQVIVDSLVANRIDRVFCVPGESYLGLLDALYERPDIQTVVCRHESGAGFMALADARLTGRLGVAMVSRGPGATNAAIAVHTAQQDAVPFLLLVGQVGTADIRRDAFQEIDYSRMFGGMAKWTAEVTNPDRMAEVMLRAMQVACTGVPGPVVVAISEDVLKAPSKGIAIPPVVPIRPGPAARDVDLLRDRLRTAERPLVIAGSGFEHPGGREALRALAEAWSLPVLVSFRRLDLFANDHPLYAGDLGLANPLDQMDVLHQADLLLVLGARLSDITTQGYTFPPATHDGMTLVHVHSDPAILGTHFVTNHAIVSCPVRLAEELLSRGVAQPPDRSDWLGRIRAQRQAIATVRSVTVDDGVPFEQVVNVIGAHLPDDAIVTSDAGAFGAALYRIVPFRPPQRLLAPVSGAMGFAIPAAVAAGLRTSDRLVAGFVGDGGFLMTCSELAVAKAHALPLKIIVSENGIYGSIRIHQAREYPGRYVGTEFTNPDFELIGAAYGFRATRIRDQADLVRLPSLLASSGPELIVVNSSVQAILPASGRRPADEPDRGTG